MQNGLPTKKPEEICDVVSRHFANIGLDLSSRIVSSDDDPPFEIFNEDFNWYFYVYETLLSW